MRIVASYYLRAYPEFVYLALYASVAGAFTSYRVVPARIRIRNSIASVSAPANWYFRAYRYSKFRISIYLVSYENMCMLYAYPYRTNIRQDTVS